MPKPKREAPAVTIANLERELHNRDVRINDLIGARDNYQQLANRREQRVAELSHELTDEQMRHHDTRCLLQEAQAKLASTEQKFEGYRMAIEDMRE